jgi:hypothetical protein
MMDPAYIEAVRLLLEAIPAVFQAPRFAMKGGTAINLFVQDLPRLSVDIDVVLSITRRHGRRPCGRWARTWRWFREPRFGRVSRQSSDYTWRSWSPRGGDASK